MTPLESLRASKGTQTSVKGQTPLEKLRATRPKKKSTLEKAEEVGAKVNKFLGGEKLADYAGAKIAKATAPEEQRQFVDDSTTGKQALASAGAVGTWVIPSSALTRLGLKGAKTGFDAARLAKEGAIFGGVEGALRSTAETNQFFSPETAKQAAIGTALGGLGGRLIGEAGTALSVSRAMRNKTPEQFTEEATQRANFGPIPEAGKPTLPQQAVIDATQGPRLLPTPRPPAIEMPSPEIAASRRLINEVPTPRTPEVIPDKTSPDISVRAKAFNSRDEFIAAEQAKNIGTKLVTSKTGQAVEKSQVLRKVSKPQLTKIWNEAHKTQPYEMLSYQKAPIAIGKRGVDTNIGATTLPKAQRSATRIEAPEIPATKTSPESVGYKEREIPPPTQATLEQEYTKAEKALEVDPTYVPGTDREKISLFNKTLAENLGKVDDFLDAIYNVNGKKLPQGLTRSAAYVLMREQAQLLTPKQLQRLTNSEPLSKAGQDLQAAKVKAGQILTNPMDMVDKLKAELLAKAEKVLTKNGVKNFLDDLECK